VNRKRLVTVLQVAVAIVVLGFVFWKVQYRDEAHPRKGVEAKRLDGRVVGPPGPKPWEADPVQFEAEGGGAVALRQDQYEVKPGILTLYGHLSLAPYAGGALLLLLGAYIASVRWWLLTRVLSIPFSIGAAVKWSFVGFFFNNVVPGLIGGDLPKMYFVARDAPNRAHAVLTVMFDRILGLLALAVVASTAFLVDYSRYASQESLWPIQWLLFGVLFGLLGGVVVLGSSTVRRILLPRERLERMPGGKLLLTLDEAVTLYRSSLGTLGACFALSILNHVLSMVAWWLFVKALGGALALGATFVVVPIVQMIKSVPLTPSGWGIGEATFAKLLPLYGESPAMGVALSVTYQLTYLLFSLAGGVILLTSRERVSAAEMESAVAAT
jgi:uncharacterized protein (TIRG00374 family)